MMGDTHRLWRIETRAPFISFFFETNRIRYELSARRAEYAAWHKSFGEIVRVLGQWMHGVVYDAERIYEIRREQMPPFRYTLSSSPLEKRLFLTANFIPRNDAYYAGLLREQGFDVSRRICAVDPDDEEAKRQIGELKETLERIQRCMGVFAASSYYT